MARGTKQEIDRTAQMCFDMAWTFARRAVHLRFELIKIADAAKAAYANLPPDSDAAQALRATAERARHAFATEMEIWPWT